MWEESLDWGGRVISGAYDRWRGGEGGTIVVVGVMVGYGVWFVGMKRSRVGNV